MVFRRTRHRADRLSDRLACFGLASAAIHGDRSQCQRERVLNGFRFRAGRLDALVATDVTVRGIHVDAVPLVVHSDPPADATDYVRRSGRSDQAGADGTVVTLIGVEHLSAIKRMQQRLGLPSGMSSPDVRLFAVAGRVVRPRRGPARVKGAERRAPVRSAPASRPVSGPRRRHAGRRRRYEASRI